MGSCFFCHSHDLKQCPNKGPDDMFSMNKKPEPMAVLCYQNWLNSILLKKMFSFQVRVKKRTSLWTARWGNVLLDDWFHFVAIWHSSTGLSLYIDGCIVQHKITPATTKFTNDTNIKNLLLGRASNTNNYYGAVILDEFYIYEYAQPESFVSET